VSRLEDLEALEDELVLKLAHTASSSTGDELERSRLARVVSRP
jgi:hypothetical protein